MAYSNLLVAGCASCVCRDCPDKASCTYGAWPLTEWCQESVYHYCGDCWQGECKEKQGQMKFY